MTNRAERRRNAKKGVGVARAGFDNEQFFRLKYELSVPGGPLRSDYPFSVSGTLDALNEADLLRGVFVKLLDAYGYTPHPKAVAGIVAEVFNPLPRILRGNIALSIIEGFGLRLSLSEEDVCADEKCGAVRERIIHPDPVGAECATETPCVRTPDGDHHDECVPLLDTTSHAPECRVHRGVDPENPIPATYKQESVVLVDTPRHYEPLNNTAIDPETGELKPVFNNANAETGGVPLSTVDANDESFVINEEDEDAGRQRQYRDADADADADDDDAGAPALASDAITE